MSKKTTRRPAAKGLAFTKPATMGRKRIAINLAKTSGDRFNKAMAMLKAVCNPRRLDGESQAEYKTRLAAQKAQVKRSIRPLAGSSTGRQTLRRSQDHSKTAGHFGKYLRDWITAKNVVRQQEKQYA